jgi:hypothetical protein
MKGSERMRIMLQMCLIRWETYHIWWELISHLWTTRIMTLALILTKPLLQIPLHLHPLLPLLLLLLLL